MSPIAAVVFDFDGLILDTEEPIYVALREVWAEHGHDLTIEMWAQSIGTNSETAFDATAELNRLAGTDYTEGGLTPRVRARIAELLAGADVLPGVLEWVAEAEARGLGVAIASSADRAWIVEHLERLGHLERFPVVSCYDDVGVYKPDPAAYLAACERLGVEPSAALAIEDSVPGLTAAKAAGLWVVAVPTAMTRHLDFSAADLVVESLAHVTLADVIARLA
ncbi:MAG TPA: HAD-IA family hydrolase [Acidimicrobiales bacterium]